MNAYGDAIEGMLNVPCSYCQVGLGQWCVTLSGHRATHLHMNRWEEWRAMAETQAPAPKEWPPRPGPALWPRG